VGIKINLFEQDPALLKLLTIILEKKGHQVEVFKEGYHCCPSCLEKGCLCAPGQACVDAMIIDTSHPLFETLEKLGTQNKNGCKLPKQKIAILSASFTEQQKQTIERMGHTPIKKPFSLSKIEEWLKS